MKVSLLKSDNSISQVEFEAKVDGSISDYAIGVLRRVYRQNQKQGTKHVKTRSEVAGRAAKPFKQKGTGNARQGSRKGPHFRGGGIAHGPTPDYKKLGLNKKFKKSVLKKILSKYIEEERFVFVELNEAKNLRKELGKEKCLVVYSASSRDSVRYIRNLEKVNLMPASNLSALMLFDYNKIYFDVNEKERLAEIMK